MIAVAKLFLDDFLDFDLESRALLKSTDASDLSLLIPSLQKHNDENNGNFGEERSRIQHFFEATISKYSSDDFNRHFRMCHETMEQVYQVVGSELTKIKTSATGRPPMPLEKSVLLTVWTLANTEPYRCISDRFGVAESTPHETFISVCQLLTGMLESHIKWPSRARMAEEAATFQQKCGIPGVIGAIDGCHIPLQAPVVDKESYFNRKCFYSIMLQAICDSRKHFIDVHCAWPGSVHDTSVFTNSPVFARLTNLLNPTQAILGDSAYPLSVNVLVPYKDNGHLSSLQKCFNKKLSSSRVVIEQAFGLLKGKFRHLKMLNMVRVDLASTVVVPAACVLHNIYMNNNDWDEDDIDLETDRVVLINNDVAQQDEAARKRDAIAQNL